MKIAAFGEILWDIVEGNFHLGGAPLNFAAHAVQCGLNSAIISALGADELGQIAKAEIHQLKVNDAFIQQSEKETGTVLVTLHNGQPEYNITKDVAYDYILPDKIDFELLNHYDSFYFGTLAQRSPVSRTCLKMILERCSFEMVFLDVNLRQSFYSFETIEFSIERCTILKLNNEEVATISVMLFSKSYALEDFASQLWKRFVNLETIIITRGDKGCLICHNNEMVYLASKPIKIADTIGAGDSFSAAFCAFYLRSNDAIASATFANQIGGFVASQNGAIPKYNFQQFAKNKYKNSE